MSVKYFVLCIGVIQCVSSAVIEKNFREVFLHKSWLQYAATNNKRTISPMVTRSMMSTVPSAICATVVWCRIICQDEDNSFIMSDIFVLPFVNESSGINNLKCWTLSRGTSLDLSTVSIVAYTAPPSMFPGRLPENLLDGIYSFLTVECWKTNHGNNPYALFDLQTITTISRVTMVAQNNANVGIYFGELEIRLGNSSVAGNDFSSYTLLGNYSGTPSPGIIYEAIPLNKQVGRFLAIQRLITDRRFQLCHLEIYT